VDLSDQARPAAATAVRRSPTVSAERPAPIAPAATTRRWPRRLALTLLVIAVLGGGGYFAARWYLDNQWYVGLNENDVVTVFQGVEGSFLGMELSSTSQVSDPPIALKDLPQAQQDSVKEGLLADSEDDALAEVDKLRSQAKKQSEFADPQPSPDGGGGNEATKKRREEKSNDGTKN
jgi:hypothetical protein